MQVFILQAVNMQHLRTRLKQWQLTVVGTYSMVSLASTVRYVVGGSNVCDWCTNHTALSRGTPHSGTSHSAMSHMYKLRSVRSVSMSVYLTLWALHVPCSTWYMCVVSYTDKPHSGNSSVSEPHSGNVNVSGADCGVLC